MTQIHSTKNFKQYLIRLTGILLAGVFIIMLLKGFSMILVILFLTIELIILSKTFTVMFSLNASEVKIVYYKWLRRKEMLLDLSEIHLRTKRTAEFRSGPFSLLQILKGGNVIYEIDSRDGFEEKDFKQIEQSAASIISGKDTPTRVKPESL